MLLKGAENVDDLNIGSVANFIMLFPILVGIRSHDLQLNGTNRMLTPRQHPRIHICSRLRRLKSGTYD